MPLLTLVNLPDFPLSGSYQDFFKPIALTVETCRTLPQVGLRDPGLAGRHAGLAAAPRGEHRAHRSREDYVRGDERGELRGPSFAYSLPVH